MERTSKGYWHLTLESIERDVDAAFPAGNESPEGRLQRKSMKSD
jgi:hypothetical protein